MREDWLNSFIIYYDNLSSYYLFCLLLSFSAVIIAWWITRFSFETPESTAVADVDEKLEEGEEEEEEAVQDGSILTQLKMARQEAIVQHLSAGLTEQQLQEERETEKQQLAAIFSLLQQQSDKFHVGSMQELEDQLRLYRR